MQIGGSLSSATAQTKLSSLLSVVQNQNNFTLVQEGHRQISFWQYKAAKEIASQRQNAANVLVCRPTYASWLS